MQTPSSSKPLLTIAIPTYNRAGFLRQLLHSLYDQLLHENRVELLVLDNASPDNTAFVIAEFQQRGMDISALRHPENIGADANFLACFQQAKGTYVWIFGDDDVIVPGGVAAVLSRIAAHAYDLVHILSFPILDLPLRSAPAVLHAKEFSRPEPFVKRVHINFTFISGNIINKDRILACASENFERLIGTNLIQLAWVYSALNEFTCGLLIEDRLVGARVDNTGGYKLTDVFGIRLKNITEILLQSGRIRQLMLSGTVQRFWPGMILAFRRSSGAFEPDAAFVRALTSTFKADPRYWFFVYPILLLPPAAGAVWFLFVRIVNRIDKALGFVL